VNNSRCIFVRKFFFVSSLVDGFSNEISLKRACVESRREFYEFLSILAAFFSLQAAKTKTKLKEALAGYNLIRLQFVALL
jgi:hypothetical protein